ncbi:MAG: MFS transporter [Nocardioides sp.]
MTATDTESPHRSARALLTAASIAVAFAAADTYVVVLALPDMMASAGIPIAELQRAAPIISGFLLGYVAMLPLIGRIADLRGRVPVLVAALVIFAVGSLLTALAYDMSSMVVGRFLQGLGGGGLVPATLALVADIYPVQRRGVPLGIVSAVQELGSVIGPLFGALVLAVAPWPAIFLINVAVGLVLAAAIRMLSAREATPSEHPPSVEGSASVERHRGHFDLVGLLLAGLAVSAAALVMVRPAPIVRDITWGQIFIPFVGDGRWLTPVGAVAIACAVLFLVRCSTARHPLVDLRAWSRSARDADLLGALLLAAALSGVILAFATADPKIEVFSDKGLYYLAVAAIASGLLAWHLARTANPLIPHDALRETAAWGSMVVSFFIGAALIAALIDIPLFARTTIYPDSQLMAALVLVRFLVALPVGAVLGGYLTRRLSAGVITCVGMVCAAAGFLLMSRWGLESLHEPSANIALVLGGLGFGLALAPVNAAVLAATRADVHGVSTALVVVARMVGMLVGISALTTLGLRRYYAEQGDIPPVREVCDGKSKCDEFTRMLKVAGIAQEQTVFLGAAGCALIAGVLALIVFRHADTKGVSTSQVLRAGG